MGMSNVFPADRTHVNRGHSTRLLALGLLLAGTFLTFVSQLYEAIGPLAFLLLSLAGGVTLRKLVAAHRGHTSSTGDVDISEYPALATTASEIATAYNIPTPAFHIHDHDRFLFIVGGLTTRNTQVHTTTTTLEQLDEDTVEGVLAHELAHLKSYHAAISNLLSFPAMAVTAGVLAAVIVGAVSIITTPPLTGSVTSGQLFGLIVLGCVYAGLHYAMAREREYIADAAAAKHLGDADQYIEMLHATAELADNNTRRLPIHPSTESRIETARKAAERADT